MCIYYNAKYIEVPSLILGVRTYLSVFWGSTLVLCSVLSCHLSEGCLKIILQQKYKNHLKHYKGSRKPQSLFCDYLKNSSKLMIFGKNETSDQKSNSIF